MVKRVPYVNKPTPVSSVTSGFPISGHRIIFFDVVSLRREKFFLMVEWIRGHWRYFLTPEEFRAETQVEHTGSLVVVKINGLQDYSF